MPGPLRSLPRVVARGAAPLALVLTLSSSLPSHAGPHPSLWMGRRPIPRSLWEERARLSDQIREAMLSHPTEDPGPAGTLAPESQQGPGGQELGPDTRVNDRIPNACPPTCQGRPLIQTEPSVAVHGSNIVVSWNEGKRNCTALGASRQNYGYSTDGGQTFVDGTPGFPITESGGRHAGDPTVAVNHKTGDFYFGGLHGVTTFDGVAGAKAHIVGNTLVFDRLTRAATAVSPAFFDKPWMTVDSLSGNVYFSWTNFNYPGLTIEFARCDANLNPLGPIQVLADLATESCGGQWSQLAVGPSGEVYAIWLEFECASNDTLVSNGRVVVRRSDDFGASFGPKAIIARYTTNGYNGAPGFMRTFASPQPSIAVDCSNGPHRGRVHVAWDEAVDYSTQIVQTTTRFETEPNNSSTAANLLVPGGKLRGVKNGLEDDWFKFDALAGQTFMLMSVITYDVPGGYDSTRAGLGARIFCRDVGGALRLVANGQATSSGLLWTAPSNGTFYLQLIGMANDVASYVFYTSLFFPQPSERARDHRDQSAAYSDDGIHWSAPRRINDSAPGIDGQYPSLAVDGHGVVHCSFMDYREDPQCSALSRQYTASSVDGGVTWGPNQRLGDVASYWPGPDQVCDQLNGNTQGDYHDADADGDVVVAAFVDPRLGDSDVYVDVTRWDDQTPVMVSLVAVSADAAGVRLEWSVADESHAPRAVWRRSAESGWERRGAPIPEDSRRWRYEDRGIVAGARYAYRLELELGGRTVFSPETWVEIPGRASFALAGLAPNPTLGEPDVLFTLDGDRPARLELYDLTGRRVLVRDVADPHAGDHRMRLDPDRHLPAGIYHLHLIQGTRRASVRAVVVR